MANHHTLARVLELFQDIDPGMTLSEMQAFMYAATNEGSTQRQIEELLGRSNATASRVLKTWTEWEKYGVKPGHDFLVVEVDPSDQRYRLVHLRPKGRIFLEKLKSLLKGEEDGRSTG